MKFLNRQKQQTCVPFYCPKILTKSYIEQSIFSYQLVCTNMGAYIWGQLKQTTSNQSPGPTKFQAFKTIFCITGLETQIWLFKSFLESVESHPPKTIFTNQSRFISKEIEDVLPRTHHCLCKQLIKTNLTSTDE